MSDQTNSTSLAINNVLPTKANPSSLRFESNMRALAELVAQVRNEEEKIREGGGPKAIESQHAKGRLTARERINLLADPGTFYELGLYTAHKMYEEWGGAPAAGVVTGLARIHTRMVMLIVNDATVKAGAFFPMTAKKVIRAQNIAIENRIPTIYLVDPAGVFLPLQEDVFPDTDDFGRVFRNNAVMSAMGIPQIPKTNLAVTGLYIYDTVCFLRIIRILKPSRRGELEITDVNNAYIQKDAMTFSLLSGFWSNAGTFDSLLRASVQVKEYRQKQERPVTSVPLFLTL